MRSGKRTAWNLAMTPKGLKRKRHRHFPADTEDTSSLPSFSYPASFRHPPPASSSPWVIPWVAVLIASCGGVRGHNQRLLRREAAWTREVLLDMAQVLARYFTLRDQTTRAFTGCCALKCHMYKTTWSRYSRPHGSVVWRLSWRWYTAGGGSISRWSASKTQVHRTVPQSINGGHNAT